MDEFNSSGTPTGSQDLWSTWQGRVEALITSLVFRIAFWLGVFAAIIALANSNGSYFYWIIILILLGTLFELGKKCLHLLRIREEYLRLKNAVVPKQIEAEHGENRCPIKSDASECPLGIIALNDQAESSLSSILDTREEYLFYGFGSENIFIELERSSEKTKELQAHVESRKADPPVFHFVIRNKDNARLIHHLEDWRYYDIKRTEGAAKNEIANAERLQRQYRDIGWDVNTYLSNRMVDFRIVIVDDVAYVSFNARGASSLEQPQVVIRNRENQNFNMFGWFRSLIDVSISEITHRINVSDQPDDPQNT
ncbi:hypothetical protein ACGF5M_00130 [Gemmatimonadota bacterium]